MRAFCREIPDCREGEEKKKKKKKKRVERNSLVVLNVLLEGFLLNVHARS